MPTISVIIPAYDSERTIVDTIVSVQQQTFSDFEIIVINDGSTDGTLKLLDDLKDSRIKVFSYENGGLSVARNRGISHAKGDFIAFLDADDLWTADKLELQLEALQKNPEAGLAYSWTYFMDEQTGNCHMGRPIFFQGQVLANLLTWNFIASGSNPLIRKQAIESVGEFEPSVSGAADWDYWLRLAAKWSFVVVTKPQIFYRQSSNSMSSKIEFMEDCQFKVLERVFKSGSPEIQMLKNHSLAYVYRYSCRLCLTRITGDEGVEKASKKLGQAIQLYPKILLQKETQKLIIKLLLKKILVENISAYLLQIISKIRVTHVQKLNIHEKRIG